jgi:beta-glucosidase
VSLPGPTPALDYRWLAPLADGQRGLRAEVFASLDLTGEPLAVETLSRGNARWAGSPAPGIPPGQFSARLLGQFVPDRSGSWEFGLASAGHARLFIDGQLVAENHDADPLFRRGRREALARLALERGSTYELVAELQLDTQQELEFAGLRVGARPVLAPDAREQAIRAAGAAEVAVVVVGYDSGWESEGSDRPHMDLPGDQDDLVRAIASVNPRTIVVVNAGAPIRMPWLDDVAAVLQLWFPGMEGGRALVDVLFGEVNPSGRLPTTFPRRLEDCPAYPGKNYPGSNGVVQYAEGVFVGYRHYDRYDLEPAFCFGHGLSYTHFAYANLRVEPVQADVRVQVDVTNVGDRPGFEVVQLYVGIPEPADDEPRKELRDFAKIQLDPGQTTTVHFRLPPRAFARWDTSTRSWHVRPGPREILIGASSRDIRQVAPFELR